MNRDIPTNIKIKIDKIASDFESQWSNVSKAEFSTHLKEIDPPYRNALFHSLISVDIELRLEAGHNVLAEDYEKWGEEAVDLARKLLQIGEKEETRATRTADRPAAKVDDSAVSSRQIGPYKLLQQIGEGGMGTVWMAEQEKPIRRRVALKLIKGAVVDKQVIARFEAERQALAMMDHQNIAKVLDAGTTAEGNPYFVMELVSGIPVNEYCDRNKLSLDERLQLFAPVCKAIQHAHQKGIIHRDLKPSNVLVQMYDGEPVAKVIDFGLAKALQHQTKLTDKTMFTEFGQVVGTLQYMSPEQATMDALAVDTRTDIYSLGVMLYELLAGSTPIEKATLKDKALLQVLEVIREEEPPKPSHRLSSSGEQLSTISELRKIQPGRLQHLLRGELDWIVMKSLEKDRTRRYESASDFAADINNYLNGDTVLARPPSTLYQIRKFTRKNKGLVTSLLAIATVLVAAVGASSWFAIKANHAKNDALEQKKIADGKTAEAELEKKRAEENEARAMAAKSLATAEAKRVRDSDAAAKFQLANARWQDSRVAEARDLLHQIPVEYRDNFEWRFCKQNFTGGDFTCYDAFGPRRLVFNREGTQILSGSHYPNTMEVWNSKTGSKIKTLVGFGGDTNITILAVSQTGERVAYQNFDDHSITIWNTLTDSIITTLDSNLNRLADSRKITFSLDGKRIAVASDDQIEVWDVQEGLISSIRFPDADTVVLSPNGRYLVSNSRNDANKGICVWNVATGSKTFALDYCNLFVFSPDGSRIATADRFFGSFIKVWDALTGAELSTLNTEQGVSSLIFSPEGSRLAYSGFEESSIYICNLVNKSLIATLKGHATSAHSLVFSPDGSRIASCDNKTIKVWDATVGLDSIDSTKHWSRPGQKLTVSSDGTRIASNLRQVWDAQTGMETVHLIGFGYPRTLSTDFSQIASYDRDVRKIKIWNIREFINDPDDTTKPLLLRPDDSNPGDPNTISIPPPGDTTTIFIPPPGVVPVWKEVAEEIAFEVHEHVKCLAFGPDGKRIAYGCDDNTIKIWDSSTKSLVVAFEGHGEPIESVKFSPNGKLLASLSHKAVKIWDLLNRKEIKSLKRSEALGSGGSRPLTGFIEFSPKGAHIAETRGNRTFRLWNLRTDSEIATYVGHSDFIRCLAFNQDGTRIASGSSDKTIKVWDVNNPSELISFKGSSEVQGIAFGPKNDNWLVSASGDRILRVFDANTESETRMLRGHAAPVNYVTLSPDGRMIASASRDKTIKVWDVRTGSTLLTLEAHTSAVSSVAFSPDGKYLYSKSSNEKLIWRLEDGKIAPGDTKWLEPKLSERISISPNGRWQVTWEGNNVVLVDLEYKNTPREKAYREHKARFNPSWHLQQAEKAKLTNDWYAATFHHAWLLKNEPDRPESYIQLHIAYEKLQEQFSSEQRPLEEHLAFVVTESLKLPRPKRLLVVGVARASRTNNSTWAKVKDPASPDQRPLSRIELVLFRDLVQQHPRSTYYNTLATAEYRMGNFNDAIAASFKSIELSKDERGGHATYPGDIAILAMSHFRLGLLEKAKEYRSELNDAIKLDDFKDDKVCQSFHEEVNQMFESKKLD